VCIEDLAPAMCHGSHLFEFPFSPRSTSGLEHRHRVSPHQQFGLGPFFIFSEPPPRERTGPVFRENFREI